MKLIVKLTFHFQTLYQKCTKHKHIKLCTIPAVVGYLTFCQQVAHFCGDESFCNFYSLHICQCNILLVSHLLLASHSHTCAYLTCASLVCCSRIAWELHASCSCATLKHWLPCGWAVPFVVMADIEAPL